MVHLFHAWHWHTLVRFLVVRNVGSMIANDDGSKCRYNWASIINKAHGKANRLSKKHSASTPEFTVLWQVAIFPGILKRFWNRVYESVRNEILFYTELHPYSQGQICHISRMGILPLNYWVCTTEQSHPRRLYFQHKIKASYFLPVWDIYQFCKKFAKFKTYMMVPTSTPF